MPALVGFLPHPGGRLAHLGRPLFQQAAEAVAILLELDLGGLVRGQVAHDLGRQR